MVELQKKYQIGTRRFGRINWVGVYSLYKKETLRFLTVFGQTIVGPVVTAILFLLVISLAIGDQRADVLGVPYRFDCNASNTTNIFSLVFIVVNGESNGKYS